MLMKRELSRRETNETGTTKRERREESHRLAEVRLSDRGKG
jgi:hypothetical protein